MLLLTEQIALYRSAWIEEYSSASVIAVRLVALYTSAWIEDYFLYVDAEYNPSRSIRVRGLKNWKELIDEFDKSVALYTSAWIEDTAQLTQCFAT